MVRASEAQAYAKQGVWTEWSRGPVTGLTVSLSEQNAAILVAGLALFIQMMGTRLWVILRFLLHQLRVTEKVSPAYYHQQQALLRNSGSSSSFLVDIVFVVARWRKKLGRSIGSFSMLWLVALVHLIGLTVLGLLSSKLVKVGDKVVISSPYCVTAIPDEYLSFNNFTQAVTRQVYANSQLQESVNYARACYVGVDPKKSICGKYAVPAVAYSTSRNVSCPFQDSVCHRGATASRFDTGLFDLGSILGVNMETDQRIYARKVGTCVPLNDALYVKVNDVKTKTGFNASSAYYGPQMGNLYTNSTFTSVNVFKDTTEQQAESFAAYELASAYAYQSKGADVSDLTYAQSFDPIDELIHPLGDLSLAFMTFPAYYQAPVDDLWFSAHRKIRYQSNTSVTSTTGEAYEKDIPISTMGCQDQYQVCVNGSSMCTDLQGILQISAELDSWSLTETQNAALAWLVQSFINTGTYNVMPQNGGQAPLLASDKLFAEISTALPTGQWRLEAEYWFAISLAWLQSYIIDYGTGQALDDVSWINTTLSKAQRDLCDNLIIRGTSLQSFDLFAIIMIFVVGVLLIVLSLTIEQLCGLLQTRYLRGLTCRRVWVANGLLQLQRLAYEAKDDGTWIGTDSFVPRTKTGELFDHLGVGANNSEEVKEQSSVSSQKTLVDDKQRVTTDKSSLMSGMDHTDLEIQGPTARHGLSADAAEREPPPLVWVNEIHRTPTYIG